jgi:hypothetical protein
LAATAAAAVGAGGAEDEGVEDVPAVVLPLLHGEATVVGLYHAELLRWIIDPANTSDFAIRPQDVQTGHRRLAACFAEEEIRLRHGGTTACATCGEAWGCAEFSVVSTAQHYASSLGSPYSEGLETEGERDLRLANSCVTEMQRKMPKVCEVCKTAAAQVMPTGALYIDSGAARLLRSGAFTSAETMARAGMSLLLAMEVTPSVCGGGMLGDREEPGLFFLAVEHGSAVDVKLLLADQRIEVNQATADGKVTPPWIAANLGKDECVKLLLSNPRVKVNQADAGRRTPLWSAANLGNDECVNLLLKVKGVEVNQADAKGRTPLWIAKM